MVRATLTQAAAGLARCDDAGMSDRRPDDADPTRCPLCGGDNRCAMELEKATGQPQPPCWCVDQTFTPELLARVPVPARGSACICMNCVRAAAGPDRNGDALTP